MLDNRQRKMIIDDFNRVKDHLRTTVPKDWAARTCVIPFLTSEGVPVSVRYQIKEDIWLEINVISEENVLQYIKLSK